MRLICLKKAVGQTVDLECPCTGPTTTTTTTPAPTTTTAPAGGQVLKGVLAKTNGRFNYNLVIGLPGADAKCNTDHPGTHACTFADLLDAEEAGDLVGIRDPNDNPVTSFWAIIPDHADEQQCTTTIPWDYMTAHTGTSRKLPIWTTPRATWPHPKEAFAQRCTGWGAA
jgi:hypothetical protein